MFLYYVSLVSLLAFIFSSIVCLFFFFTLVYSSTFLITTTLFLSPSLVHPVILSLTSFFPSFFLQQVFRHRDIALLYKDRWLTAQEALKSNGIQSKVCVLHLLLLSLYLSFYSSEGSRANLR